MDLNKTPYTTITDAFAEASFTARDQTYCNTHFHTLIEISTALPDIEHLPPDPVQPWILLSPWIDIVKRSQRLHDDSVHQIRLPGPFLALLASAIKVGIYMGRLNASDAEDLEECFPKKTTRDIPLSELFADGQKYFARLDTCSLKDAADGPTGAVTSVKQLWTRLATSARGSTGIRALRAFDENMPIYLYLFPWNERIRTEREYRVFCPPDTGRIAAISQYKWHQPWVHAGKEEEEQRTTAEGVWRGAVEIFKELMVHPSMTESMKKSGFTFDICEGAEGDERVVLIELNDFGAMSGCGSCLYHWIRDARVLYGLKEKVELRVAV